MENQNEDTVKKLYSKEEVEKLIADYEEKLKLLENKSKEKEPSEIQKNETQETEKLKLELEEMKKKYQEKENECIESRQKEMTLALLNEANLSPMALNLVFTPLNEDATKEKIEILKNLIEEILEENYGRNFNSEVPLASKRNSNAYDAFIEGFDTNRL